MNGFIWCMIIDALANEDCIGMIYFKFWNKIYQDYNYIF